MEGEKCECKGCGGKVLLTLIISVVITALVVGGAVTWLGGKSTSTTSTSSASTNFDPTKGEWRDYNNDRLYIFNTPGIHMYVGDVYGGGNVSTTDKAAQTEWIKFIKTLQVVAGDKTNEAKLVAPTTDSKYTNKQYTLLKLTLYTSAEWKANAFRGDEKVYEDVIDVSQNGVILADTGGDSLDEFPSDFSAAVQEGIALLNESGFGPSSRGYRISFENKESIPVTATPTTSPTSSPTTSPTTSPTSTSTATPDAGN